MPLPSVQFAARTPCAPTWHWINPAHHRNCLNLWLIVGGRGVWSTPERSFALSAGDCFVQRLWQPSEGTTVAEDPLVVLWANLGLRSHDGALLSPKDQPPTAYPPLHRRVRDLGVASLLAGRMIEAFEADGAGERADRWLACVWDEIAVGSAAEDREAQDLQRLIAEVRAHPERAWRVAGLAHRFGEPVDRFSRRVRAATGLSPRALLVRARLDAAKAMLRMSNLGIGEIARRLGFCDIYHFSRRFRSHVGCAPSHYRRGSA
jgi:AraC-like DNA-binding protein